MAVPSSSSSFTYDVFLSFRGTDTRYGFTGNLYKALLDKGIRTFFDEELQRGEEITRSLLKAIENSRNAIVVLSENYASSSFCLDELSNIIHCVKGNGGLVLPVFYTVDPSHVRHQRGSYGDALDNHENKFKAKTERLKTWRTALHQVANLSGFHFKHGDEYEHDFIESIVKEVSKNIKRVPLPVADYPVGLESRVEEVKLLMDAGSNDGVYMIGIHGIGGVGKTTLALAVYNSVAEYFEGLCFLQNVRENSNTHGLQHLQEILLGEMFGEEKIKLASTPKGSLEIQHRLPRKKVLLILDDVDTLKQLQALGRPDWFGPGSRVIITTRDKQLLACHEVKKTYEVKDLDEEDALQLLRWNAFKTNKVDPSYTNILNRALTYASGLPLALEVIGSNLFGKSIDKWESALNQYQRIPPKHIQKKLEVSYDALEEEEKSVFLDIACCFKGYPLPQVQDILHAHYDECMKYHIGALVGKSLIKIDWHGKVTLHDLIEGMGKEIVRRESPDEPGERSRLWFHEDIVHVLIEDTGTNKIGIIYLDSPLCDKEEVGWSGKAFAKMKKLKTLIIRHGCFSTGPEHLPNSLRILEWRRYPLPCLPSDFHPKQLAICKIMDSCFTSPELLKKFVNMRVLNFDDCNYLKQIPDVSGLQNLEEFSFKRCMNLTTIHDSVGLMDKLRILDCWGCVELGAFPPIKLTSLETLNLSQCSSLESFPEILGEMKNKVDINLIGTGIKELPSSFENLTGLRTLHAPTLIISGNKGSKTGWPGKLLSDHKYLFDLQPKDIKLDEVPLKNEWNRVKVRCIYVFEEKNSMGDIQFSNPNPSSHGNRDSDNEEYDLQKWLREFGGYYPKDDDFDIGEPTLLPGQWELESDPADDDSDSEESLVDLDAANILPDSEDEEKEDSEEEKEKTLEELEREAMDIEISETRLVKQQQHMGLLSHMWNWACSCFPFFLLKQCSQLDDNVN